MINNIYLSPKATEFDKLCQRPKKEVQSLEKVISEIFEKVKNDGDSGLRELTKQYDNVALEGLAIARQELMNAKEAVPEKLRQAINTAYTNIRKFHKEQLPTDLNIEIQDGVTCSQRAIPIERVGLYIPGGTAPLFSTVLMLAVPAQLAGCKELILCTPPDANGNINQAILYAADLCGITQIYKVGGAQAIAAMTLGTESILRVAKIFGPGNQYVTAAKAYAAKYNVAMDMPAGPSELLVYADDSAVPAFVAADLLSQAEHGTDSQVILVTKSEQMVTQVNQALELQLPILPRAEIAAETLENSRAVVVEEVKEAWRFINQYGPEHLIIASENPDQYVDFVINAGSVFLGNYCPESAGDYASGTNHTLPTDGWAHSYSGLNIDAFLRKVTFQSITKEGLLKLGPTIETMALGEQLQAHANAVTLRINALNDK